MVALSMSPFVSAAFLSTVWLRGTNNHIDDDGCLLNKQCIPTRRNSMKRRMTVVYPSSLSYPNWNRDNQYTIVSSNFKLRMNGDDNFDETKNCTHAQTMDTVHGATIDPIVTSEILSIRFRAVLNYYQNLRLDTSSSAYVQQQQLNETMIRTNLLRTRHVPMNLHKCQVRTSTIPNAGYGVFITQQQQSIQPNELITLYPGDATIQWDDKNHMDDHTLRILFGTHIPDHERINAISSKRRHNHTIHKNDIFMQHIPTARNYEVRISDTISMIGDPNRYNDSAYLGHMINDYCTLSSTILSDTISNDQKESFIRQYNIESIQHSNCKIQVGKDGCHVEIIATKPISVGEECFLSYGTNYWLSRLQIQQPQIKSEGILETIESLTDRTVAGFSSNTKPNSRKKVKKKSNR